MITRDRVIFHQVSDFDRPGQMAVYARDDGMPYVQIVLADGAGDIEVLLTRNHAISLMHALDRWTRR